MSPQSKSSRKGSKPRSSGGRPGGFGGGPPNVQQLMLQAQRMQAQMDEAQEQHGSAREFIARILCAPAEDALYDAKVAVLAEYVERHVRQEREQVFNRLLASGHDLQSLGASIATRRKELRAVSDALREDTLSHAQP